jgi:hypothetical protein
MLRRKTRRRFAAKKDLARVAAQLSFINLLATI